eukprot:10726390-Ditylum_brightwellii.AAC.1
MSFALKMYNNKKSLREWKTKNILAKKRTKDNTKYLALLTQMVAIAKLFGGAKPTKSDGRDGKGTPREVYSSWRYQNPDSKETVRKGNCMLKWCTNNCHACPMWCGQNNCLPCKEYQKKREEEGKGGAGNAQKKRYIFKVALFALLSDNVFKSNEEQFLTRRQGRQELLIKPTYRSYHPRLRCTLAPPHCSQGQLHEHDPSALCVHWSRAQQGLDVGDLDVMAEEVVS